MLAFCSFNLRFHAGTNRITEHPQFRTLTQQYNIHENCGFPFLRDIVVHELREVDMRRDRQVMAVNGKAAVSLGVLYVPLRISGVRRTDVHNRTEGSSFRRSLFRFLNTGERLIFRRAVVSLVVILICHA